MDPEAAFLAGYAAALVGLAAGFVALGRRSTDPWSSKVLAASRPPASEPRNQQVSWIHSDVPAFHLCISAVALGAALLLTAVSAVRHHRPLELAVHLALLAVIAMSACRLRNTARSASGGYSSSLTSRAQARRRRDL